MPLASWQTGVLASLVGSLCGTLGGQLRICSLTCAGRVAHILQASGWTFWLAGQGLGQVAILLAPATVAACVTFSSSLLCNALLAPLVLNEQLTQTHVLGVGLLSIGGTAVTWASCGTGRDYTWSQLCALGRRPESLFLVTACLGVAGALLARGVSRSRLDVLSFAFLFALCGSMDLLVTKFTLQMLRLQVIAEDPAQVPPGDTVAVFVVLMLLMHCATFGFQVASVYYRKALESLPLFLGSGAIMQISLCGVFYKEFNFDRAQATAFLSGVCLVLCGLLVTSHAAPGSWEDSEEDYMDVEVQAAGSQTPQPTCEEPYFRPPTARSPKHSKSHLPIISSGLLERSSSSLSSADLFLVGEIQRSAMCFGGGAANRNLQSMPVLSKPLLRSFSHPESPLMGSEQRSWCSVNSAPSFATTDVRILNGFRETEVGASAAAAAKEEARSSEVVLFPPVPEAPALTEAPAAEEG